MSLLATGLAHGVFHRAEDLFKAGFIAHIRQCIRPAGTVAKAWLFTGCTGNLFKSRLATRAGIFATALAGFKAGISSGPALGCLLFLPISRVGELPLWKLTHPLITRGLIAARRVATLTAGCR